MDLGKKPRPVLPFPLAQTKPFLFPYSKIRGTEDIPASIIRGVDRRTGKEFVASHSTTIRPCAELALTLCLRASNGFIIIYIPLKATSNGGRMKIEQHVITTSCQIER